MESLQLFIGGILDSFGRYKLSLILPADLCRRVSIVIANTHNIYLIYLMRIIHGFTVEHLVIVAKRAFFVDVYEGDKLEALFEPFFYHLVYRAYRRPFIRRLSANSSLDGNQTFHLLAGSERDHGHFGSIYIAGETLEKVFRILDEKIIHVYIEMIRTTSFSLGIVIAEGWLIAWS